MLIWLAAVKLFIYVSSISSFKLFKWATDDNLFISRKILSFYRLSDAMATKLQGLFLLFIHDLMEKSSEILTELTKSMFNFFFKYICTHLDFLSP